MLSLAALVCAAACCTRPAADEPRERRACLPAEELARVAARAPAPPEEELMKKLDPRLVTLVADVEKAARGTGSATRAAATADAPCIDAEVEVMIWFTGSVDDLVAAGLKLEWSGKNDRGFLYATGRVAPSRLTELAAVPHVVTVEPTNKMTPELSDSVPAIGVQALRQVHADATGAGVVVAVIDEGFDWTHGSFRDATGRTRILAIWDFVAAADGLKPGEVGFEARKLDDPTQRFPAMGVCYDRHDINFSLGYPVDPADKPNPVKVRTRDPERPFDPKQPDQRHGHGTHVGGIAAGDGSPVPCCRPWGSGRYQGVAPGAEIIVVRGNATDTLLPRSLSFIDEKAGTKPVVVNVSLGFNSGPHDGTTAAEKAIDWFVSQPNGRIFVKSAGNEGHTKKHARITVPAQAAGPPPAPGIAELDAIIPGGMNEGDQMEIWYSQQGSLELQLTPQGAAQGGTWLGLDGNQSFAVDTANPPTRITAIATGQRPENGDRRILLVVPKHPGEGELTFTMRFRSAGAAPVVVDAWISKGRKGVTFANPTVEGTLTTPGTALQAISVANHALPSSTCGSGGDIHESSSRGPVRVVPADPAQAPLYAKPTLAAPGTSITSAKPDAGCRCCPEWLQDHYQALSGTSMAAPHVAGVIALMLQKNKTLTAAQVRDILNANATAVEGPATAWGAGKLDAKKAWEAVPAPAAPPPAPGARAMAGAAGARVPEAALAEAAAFAPAPVAAAPALAPPPGMHPALHVLRETVRRLPEGELCAALVSRHFSEVRRLINSNAKVATMWHRADGPHMLRRLAVGTVEAGAPAPLRGDGDRAYLVRMLEQLHRYGSPSLQASIDRYQHLLLRMLEAPLAARLVAT